MFKIYINNEEVVCASKIEIKEEFMNSSSIILDKVFPKSWKGTNKLFTDYYFPKDYSQCLIYKDDELYFSGLIKNSANMELSPFKPHYTSIQVLDPTTLLSEGNLLDIVLTDCTVSEAIEKIINEISDYGFELGNVEIENDTEIGTYSCKEKAPYDVFTYLSQISNSRWGTRLVDADTTAIDFYSPELMENEGTIEYTQNYFVENKIQDIKYSYSTSDYRNKQVMTSDQVNADISYIEHIFANGYDEKFSISNPISSISEILVDGVSKTFITKTEKDIGNSADFYYTFGSNEIESDYLLNSGTNIKITYIPLIKGRKIVIDSAEVDRINKLTGRKGIIARYENRSDTNTTNELTSIGNTYIKYKGKAEITLTISSRKDFLKIGGSYYFNAPLNDLKGNYLVKEKNTKVVQTDGIVEEIYTYKLTNSFDTENELNYFDNQRSKLNGNISDGEYIERNIDIINTATLIWFGETVEEVS